MFPIQISCTVYPKKYAHGFCFAVIVVVIHWLIFPYPSGLLHWHCGNLTIAPVPAKQPWWIWINTSCEFIMNDCITTTKQSTTKPCAYFLGYTVLSHQLESHPHTSWPFYQCLRHMKTANEGRYLWVFESILWCLNCYRLSLIKPLCLSTKAVVVECHFNGWDLDMENISCVS